MELRIDLTDREEIAAGVSLLQMILANTFGTSCAGQCQGQTTVTHAVGNVSTTATGSVDQLHALGMGQQDPAAVFGGQQVGGPLAQPNTTLASTPVGSAPGAATAPTTMTHGGASSAAPAGSVELDKNGLPWDERINTATKGKTAKGVWKRKPGLEDAYFNQVEAELRAHAGNLVSSQPSTSSVPPSAADPAAVFGGNAPSGAPTLPTNPPVAPGIATSPTASGLPAADPVTFEQLMPRITAAVTAGTLPATAIGAAVAAHGLASVVALQTAPQYVPLVWAYLRQQFPGLV